MRLGEILLSEKLVTLVQLDEALEAQVIHGGRLGTNLLELGLIQEKDLARCLGKQHGTAFSSGEMKPDPRALALVSASFADAKDVVPMRVEATRLTVAVLNPRDLAAMDSLAFKTGKRVVPVVVPEFRLNQLLRRHYNAFRSVRALDLSAAAVQRAAASAAESSGPAADLMSEDEFQSLYAKALAGGAAEEAALESAEILEEPSVSAMVPLAPPIDAPAPSPVARALPPSAFTPRPAPPEAMPGSRPPAQVSLPTPLPPRAPADDALAPLAFADAQAQLARSEDREEIARTILRFAIGKWKRALLLAVQANLVTGWHGAGVGIRPGAVQRIGVALRGQSTFRLVRDTRSHYIGPVRRDAGMAVFYKLLGGNHPTTAVLLPLLVRGKVVHILYVDNGPGQLTPPDIGELLILGQSVGRLYETLLRRRMSH